MATQTVEGVDTAQGTNLERMGVVNRVLAWVDQLPGPAVAWYALLGGVLSVAGHLAVWASAAYQVGTFSSDVMLVPFMFAWFLWLLHTLNRVAADTFDEFRSALGDPDSESDYLRQLTGIRDRDALAAGIVAVLIVTTVFFLFVRPTRVPLPFEIERITAPLWGATGFVCGIVVLHTIKQLRLVSKLSAVARNVDIFKPGPINAFSRLTAVSALGLIAFLVAFMISNPDQPIPFVVQEIALLAVAVASFVLPLRVMHARLVVEKRRLLGDAQERLKAVLGRVHAAIDANDLAVSEALRNALESVRSEIDVLDHLRTWPWSTSTIRGFVTALLLPIGLIVFSQVVSRFLGA